MIHPETVDAVHDFIIDNDVTLQQQWFQLLEEIGEAAEALNRNDMDAFRAELVDMHYVLISLVLLRGDDHEDVLHEKSLYNLQKSGDKDGSKVVDDV